MSDQARSLFYPYSNLETYTVGLWISKSAPDTALRLAGRIWDLTRDDCGLSREHWAILDLAKELELWFHTQVPANLSPPFQELLQQAQSRIHWGTIAQLWIEHLHLKRGLQDPKPPG